MRIIKALQFLGFISMLQLPCKHANAQDFLQYRPYFKITDWKFHKGETSGADNGNAIDEAGWQAVTVPHTWNAQDVLTDGPNYYQGIGWYRTTFTLERNQTGSRYFIRFEGVSLVSEIYFNGHYLGTHKGAYAAFIYEITPFIRNGEENFLAVKVNNATQLDVAPSGTYLYPLFGGIYRPVKVFRTSNLCISPLDAASSGTYITADSVSRSSASVYIKTLLHNVSLPEIQTKSDELKPPSGESGNGLRGAYFANPDFKGKPLHSRIDEEIQFQYGNKAPFGDMPNDGFSVVWTGRFCPTHSGNYHFMLSSDDGSRLYLNNKNVIDHWGIHATSEKTYDTTLEAGQELLIKLEYYEYGGGASVAFAWMYQKPNDLPANAFLTAEIADSAGNIVALDKQSVTMPNNTEKQMLQHLHLTNPQLWDAKRRPYRYVVKMTLSDSTGKPIDQLEQPLGLRNFRIDKDSGLIINNKPFHLYGVCRHQEIAGKGAALTDEDHKQDFELINEMGANGIRFAHYQQADIMYHLCDSAGLVAWAEIPNTPAYRGNIPGYFQNCQHQLSEMIKQNYNHPSILFWGLYNEIDIPAEDVAALNKTAKSIDTTRLTTQADFTQPAKRHAITDVVAWNRYFGWYYGNFADYCPWFDKLHTEYPLLKGGISEYGAEACISQQVETPERPDPQGRFFPEQYQTLYHEEVWRNIKDRQDIWCKFIWNMYDFSWTYATRGDKPYMNYKGLVTHNRLVKKDAFYFYKSNWSNEPTLHIVSKRNANKHTPTTQVAVYTNLSEVELYVNGGFISKKTMLSDIHKIVWENIVLKQGRNQISIIGIKDNKKFTDNCEWYFNK